MSDSNELVPNREQLQYPNRAVKAVISKDGKILLLQKTPTIVDEIGI